jgi:hypothetical protein
MPLGRVFSGGAGMGGIVVGVDGWAQAVDALPFDVEESRYRSCPVLVVEVSRLPFIAKT